MKHGKGLKKECIESLTFKINLYNRLSDVFKQQLNLVMYYDCDDFKSEVKLTGGIVKWQKT